MRSMLPTHDGGASWGPPSELGNPVVAMAAAGGRAYALVAMCGIGAGNCPRPTKLYESTVGREDWHEVEGLDLPSDARGDVAANGHAAYVAAPGVFYGRTTAHGWQPRTPPCAQPVRLAALTELSLVATCLSTGGMTEVLGSSDGGWRWNRVSEVPLKQWSRSLAATGTDVFLAMGPGGLRVSRDSGRTYSLALQGDVSAVTFGSEQVGAAIVGRALTRPGRLMLTKDGGRTWSEAQLPSPGQSLPGS